MARFYLSDIARPNGDHEVHREDCSYLPDPEKRTYLGDYFHCAPAVRNALAIQPRANGCFHCARPCHHADETRRS